ncbi:MAG: hypothetical protein P4M15_00490 [Alphaproteobacteria bacterium]|nr:hypothetical protein [Alphaproteobacteria bacterium]
MKVFGIVFYGIMFCALLDAGTSYADNKANNVMLKFSSSEQAIYLGKAAGCIGKKAFYMGIGTKDEAKDEAFWSLKCTNGSSYMVSIKPDAMGSTQILECALLEYMHGGKCFKKFPDEK